MSLKKILLGTAIGGGIVAGIAYMRRLSQTSAELQTVTKVNIFKLDLTGLTLRVDVQIKNPSRIKFAIKFPFIKLSYKGTVVGSSQSVNQSITIPAYGQAVAEKIMIEIPILKLLSLGAGTFSALKNGDPITIQATTLTTIDLGIKKVPYQKTENIVLKK